MSSLIIFIAGWFICCVWAVGFKYLKSKHPQAKALGVVSVVLFFMTTITVLIIIIVEVVAVATVASAASQNNMHGTTGY